MLKNDFLIIKKGDAVKANYWFDYCEKNKIPYVVIKNKIKYSNIEYDFITNIENSAFLNNNSDKIIKEATNIFNKYAGKKSYFSISAHVIMFFDIPIEKSKYAAQEVYDLISEILDNNHE